MVEGCILRTTERDSSCTKQVPAAHGEKEVNKQWLNLFDDLEVSKGHQKKHVLRWVGGQIKLKLHEGGLREGDLMFPNIQAFMLRLGALHKDCSDKG